jgi:hypothetical protein
MTGNPSAAERVAAELSKPGTTRESAIFEVAKALQAAGQVESIAEGIRQAHACLPPPRIRSVRTCHHDWSGTRYLLRQQITAAEIAEIHRGGGTRYHVRQNKQTGRFEYRRTLGRGVWAKRLPRFPIPEDARISAAARKVAIRKRASQEGVTARQNKAKTLEDLVVTEFARLGARVPPMPPHNRTAEIARIVGKSKTHVMQVLVKHGLRITAKKSN